MTSRQIAALPLHTSLTRAAYLARKPNNTVPFRHLRDAINRGSMATIATFKIPKVVNEPNVSIHTHRPSVSG